VLGQQAGTCAPEVRGRQAQGSAQQALVGVVVRHHQQALRLRRLSQDALPSQGGAVPQLPVRDARVCARAHMRSFVCMCVSVHACVPVSTRTCACA